jgi:hypothetical protein
MSRARKALEELGWQVRAYTGDHLSSLVSTWAKRFPERTILIAAGGRGCGHAMVLRGGRIYDSHHPFGVDGADHIYSNAKVTWAAMVSYPG